MVADSDITRFRRVRKTPSLEPLWFLPEGSTLQLSPGLGLTNPARVDANRHPLEFNDIPISPTSTYSFDSFIQSIYVSPRQSVEMDISQITEMDPKSYFSPDSAEFDEKWTNPAFEDSDIMDGPYVPYSPRTASISSLETMPCVARSIPPVVPTVSLVRVRAVRRSIRQSISSIFSTDTASSDAVPPYEDTILEEASNSTRQPSWRLYTGIFKRLNPSTSSTTVNATSDAHAESEGGWPPTLNVAAERSSPAPPPYSFLNGEYRAPSATEASCTAGGYICRKSRSTPALKAHHHLNHKTARRKSDTDISNDSDMDGIDDSTLEAARIAASLSKKWKFEPLHDSAQVGRRLTTGRISLRQV